ncbi:MAG: DMT family transporter [Pseudomonadota bacterium]
MSASAPKPLTAALWMIGAIAAFTSMAVAGRAMASELDTFEIMMYRSFIGLIIVVVITGLLGRWREVTTDRLPLHAARNFFHFTGQNLWFYAVALIPFAQLFALEFTTPLWVTLLAPFLLGEKLTRTRILAASVGFLGILIVARPGSVPITSGVVAAASSAIAFAGSIILTKILTRTASVTCILFWLTVMQSVFGIVAAGYDGDVAVPSGAAWPLVILIGCAGLLAHLCLTKALTVAPAIIVVPMDFLRLPIVAIIGAAFYGEALDPLVITGAIVIFAANYYNIWIEAKAARQG